LTGDRDFTKRLETDYRGAELRAADRAMLEYSAKLTLRPWDVTEDDVQELRARGFSDRAILDIAQVVAYYAYVNRIADGLGVSLESYWAEGKEDYDSA
jgi:uncharacterized peroxidase-related enzyme